MTLDELSDFGKGASVLDLFPKTWAETHSWDDTRLWFLYCLSLFFFFFRVCVCVCVCARTCMCLLQTYVCSVLACTCGGQWLILQYCHHSLPYFLNTGSHWTWSLQFWFDWLVSEALRSTSPPPSADITGVTPNLDGCWWSELSISFFPSKLFTHWATFLPLHGFHSASSSFFHLSQFSCSICSSVSQFPHVFSSLLPLQPSHSPSFFHPLISCFLFTPPFHSLSLLFSIMFLLGFHGTADTTAVRPSKRRKEMN